MGGPLGLFWGQQGQCSPRLKRGSQPSHRQKTFQGPLAGLGLAAIATQMTQDVKESLRNLGAIARTELLVLLKKGR